VRFAQQSSATRCPLDLLLPSQNSVSANMPVVLLLDRLIHAAVRYALYPTLRVANEISSK